MKQEENRFELAAEFLPIRLRNAAMQLPPEEQREAEELRLRAGHPMTVLLPDGERPLGAAVTPQDLEMLCDLATDFSRYAAAETIRAGYLPVRGGFRIGLCGTAVMKNGICTNLRELSSAMIRISRERIGIADSLVPQLFRNGVFQSTLIFSPPGGGKTTLLRDMVRCLSEGSSEVPPQRISLLDERGEIAVCCQGVPQLQVGDHTDVLDACPKYLGIPMVLRAMNPQIIAADEITAQADLEAVCLAAGCGVGLLATIHTASLSELIQKPLYRALLDAGVFRCAVSIQRKGQEHQYALEELPC